MHGLPTKYINFKHHCNNRMDEFFDYINRDLSDESVWNNFEEILGDFDDDQYYDDTCLNTQAESWGEAAGVADDISESATILIELVKKEFSTWIDGIDYGAARKILKFEQDTYYFSFNYTSSLEVIYGINKNRIKYIHGSAESYDDLIFGHGRVIIEEPELDENGDSNRHPYTDAKSAAKIPLYALRKNVEEIIQNESAYFKSLSSIKSITVIGHSLNDIDMPYFDAVNVAANKPHWHVYYHDDKDSVNFKNKMNAIGIEDSRLHILDIKMKN